MTELKDYQIATCEPVIQSRRPNNRIDKVRHMFNKKKIKLLFTKITIYRSVLHFRIGFLLYNYNVYFKC